MQETTNKRIISFIQERDWDQFHSPENLAKSIVIEAAELLECFQWNGKEYKLEKIEEELADVIIYTQQLVNKLSLDIDQIVLSKIERNEKKYPKDKAKGNSNKYNEL